MQNNLWYEHDDGVSLSYLLRRAEETDAGMGANRAIIYHQVFGGCCIELYVEKAYKSTKDVRWT
jgi:hypothetical protein